MFPQSSIGFITTGRELFSVFGQYIWYDTSHQAAMKRQKKLKLTVVCCVALCPESFCNCIITRKEQLLSLKFQKPHSLLNFPVGFMIISAGEYIHFYNICCMVHQ
ncbi:uncharacterized protein LOC141716886 isoform X1 [Apium graveolens]|uniref:uncharacterized protein LOC141716886 isoform X1 n=1 Tax=Apium graveolens TaxID=4045 RepID=UPI003D79FD5D